MEVARRLLDLGAHEASVIEVREKSLRIPFKSDEIGPIALSEKRAYGLYVVYDKRPAYTYYIGNPSGLEEVLAKAVSSAKASTRLEDRPGLPSDQGLANAPGIYDESVVSAIEGDLSKALEIVNRVRELAESAGVELSRNSLELYERERRLANSNGIDKSFRETLVVLTVQTLYGKGSTREFEISRGLDIDVDAMMSRAVKKAKDADKAELANTFSGEAVFDPAASAELVSIMFGSSIRGDQVLKNASPLKDKLGSEIASKEFTLRDDGTLERGIATRPFDDEGVATENTAIVSAGRLESYIYNRYRGHKANARSTGNGFVVREGYPPSVSPSNLVLEPHKGTLDDLVSEVDRGLLIANTIGARLSDPIGGIYNATVTLGYLIESGEIKKPVKGVVVNIPFRESLKEVRVAAEPVRNYMNAYAPPVSLPNATFAAKR